MRIWRGLIAVLVGILVACSPGNELKTGVVLDKDYDDPDEYTTTECAQRGGNGICVAFHTAYHHDGAHYKLQIQGETEDGKEKTEWFTVDEQEYHAYNIGNTWVKGTLPCTGQC